MGLVVSRLPNGLHPEQTTLEHLRTSWNRLRLAKLRDIPLIGTHGAELIGGVLLVGIGSAILYEHLMTAG
jgi:hypothetical protein